MSFFNAKLGDVLTLKRGHDLPKAVREPGPVPVVSSSGITGYHNQARMPAPGVVTGRYGTLGEVYFIDSDYWPLNTSLYVCDFKGNNPRYVAYLLRETLKTYESDKAAVPGVDRKVLHTLNVRTADRAIQEKIVSTLSAYDDLIDNNRRRMALLEDAARQLYREWFVRLRFPGHEATVLTNRIPTGWKTVALGECAHFLSGGTPPKSRSEYWGGAIPWVSSKDLQQMRVTSTVHRLTRAGADAGTRMVQRTTILAVVRGMSLAKEFRIGLTSQPMTFNQDLKAIVPNEQIDVFCLFHALESERDRIRERAGEASHGTKKLETAVLASLPILIPDPLVQSEFRRLVEPMHDCWDTLTRQTQILAEARDLLLPRLMRGELKP